MPSARRPRCNCSPRLDRHEPLAIGGPVRLLDDAGSQQQNLRRAPAQLQDSALRQLRCRRPAPLRDEPGPHTPTALGAFYRRLAARAGKATAITATARKLAVLVYRALSGDLVYQDPGATAYRQLNRAREFKNLRKRAKLLGFELYRPIHRGAGLTCCFLRGAYQPPPQTCNTSAAILRSNAGKGRGVKRRSAQGRWHQRVAMVLNSGSMMKSCLLSKFMPVVISGGFSSS